MRLSLTDPVVNTSILVIAHGDAQNISVKSGGNAIWGRTVRLNGARRTHFSTQSINQLCFRLTSSKTAVDELNTATLSDWAPR